jgi:hypothetical protein
MIRLDQFHWRTGTAEHSDSIYDHQGAMIGTQLGDDAVPVRVAHNAAIADLAALLQAEDVAYAAFLMEGLTSQHYPTTQQRRVASVAEVIRYVPVLSHIARAARAAGAPSAVNFGPCVCNDAGQWFAEVIRTRDQFPPFPEAIGYIGAICKGVFAPERAPYGPAVREAIDRAADECIETDLANQTRALFDQIGRDSFETRLAQQIDAAMLRDSDLRQEAIRDGRIGFRDMNDDDLIGLATTCYPDMLDTSD